MIQLANPICIMAPAFERYITIHGLDGDRTYDYAARGFRGLPAVRHTRHGAKCAAGESWLYVAVPEGTRLASILDPQKLYVGSQTADRMFRGDDQRTENFHHAQMRCDGRTNGLIPFLRSTRQGVEIFRASKPRLLAMIANDDRTRWLTHLASEAHFAALVEDLVLHSEPHRTVWQWNKKGASTRGLDALRAAYQAAERSART